VRAARWLVAALIAATGFAAPATGRAAQGLEGVPSYQHVAIVVLENESFDATWGAASPATYLKSLVAQGAFADMYFATGHVSLDNYITMTSGQPGNPATYSDCAAQNLFQCQATVNTAAFGNGINIADQVETAGLSWKGYMDSMPGPCFHADLAPAAPPPDPYQGNSTAAPAGNYADRHNPFIYYTDITGNATRCQSHVVPYTQLATDISGDAVPTYSFITPDTCHDGHDATCAGGGVGGLAGADAWLQGNMPSLISYLSGHNGLLLITFDEGSASPPDTSGCCTGGPGGAAGAGGRVGLLALGAGVAVGTTTHSSYDHASLLRTTEDAMGISAHLNNSAATGARSMSDLFAGPGAATPDVPLAALLPLAGVMVIAVVTVRRRRWRRALVR
jgi:phosphatidylinositol-3-phosphatase